MSPHRWRIEPCVSWGAAISESEVQDEWVRLDCDTMLGVRCKFSEEQGEVWVFRIRVKISGAF